MVQRCEVHDKTDQPARAGARGAAGIEWRAYLSDTFLPFILYIPLTGMGRSEFSCNVQTATRCSFSTRASSGSPSTGRGFAAKEQVVASAIEWDTGPACIYGATPSFLAATQLSLLSQPFSQVPSLPSILAGGAVRPQSKTSLYPKREPTRRYSAGKGGTHPC